MSAVNRVISSAVFASPKLASSIRSVRRKNFFRTSIAARFVILSTRTASKIKNASFKSVPATSTNTITTIV